MNSNALGSELGCYRKGKEKERNEKEESRQASSSYLWHSDGRDSLDQEVNFIYVTRATRGYQN